MNEQITMKHEEIEDKRRPIMLDTAAVSKDPDLPAFLAKPEGAPVYYGFPIVPESMTDGWCLGVITDYLDLEGCDSGDAYVVAPDGWRAGLVWDVGEGDVRQISPPDDQRWGVYQIWFSRPIRTTDDLVDCFREVLPQLKTIHDRLTERV